MNVIEKAKEDPRFDSNCLKNVENQWKVVGENAKQQVSNCLDKQYNDLVKKATGSCVS